MVHTPCPPPPLFTVLVVFSNVSSNDEKFCIFFQIFKSSTIYNGGPGKVLDFFCQ